MSNDKQIQKRLELPHRETLVGINTIQTNPFDNQKTTTMSNNKQSSVEWLIDKCACADLRPELWNIIKEPAKAMHKEEHAATARDWWVEGASDAHKTPTGKYESFHDYYAKKFKQ